VCFLCVFVGLGWGGGGGGGGGGGPPPPPGGGGWVWGEGTHVCVYVPKP
jgi:hypothetical protein